MRLTAGKYFLLLVSVISGAVPSLAQRNISKRIDQLITAEMENREIPGVAVAILRNGRISILKTYGLANLEHRVPVKPETIFQSGSMAKQFTAAAVLLLAQDGKISLDDKLIRFVPDAPDAWKNITVRHLLTHTSGFGDIEYDERFI